MTQSLQVVVQNLVIRNVLQMQKKPHAPVLVKLFKWFPALRRIPGRIIGMGFRPEHVRTRGRLTPASRAAAVVSWCMLWRWSAFPDGRMSLA
jgi:hypothetical protein